MAFTISGSLVIDETSGTQNATDGGSDSTGNDVAGGLATLGAAVPEFDALLTEVVGVGVEPSGVSVSNANADNSTGTPLLTNLGADVTDLAFTDSAGDPLNGDVAKFGAGAGDFLLTADGFKIYLYSYSVLAAALGLPADLSGVDENNVVFGVKADAFGNADPAGDIVFAAYLQPTGAGDVVLASDTGATGAKVWMVEYEPIQHGTAGATAADHDDARILYDPLFVTVSNRTDFSLEGAPSGQNLFLMYGDGTPAAGEAAIVVTGKNPINQSIDPSGITSGDTVNTGQGGGSTTIGSNNQMIDPAEGMYFSFVTLAADSVGLTVPNLDQNEADVEANIKFDSYLGVNEAIFTVVQLQPPKASTLLITALNNTDGTEKGDLFIDGLGDGDDTQVNVTDVKITRTVKTGNTTTTTTYNFSEGGTTSAGGLTLDFTGNTVKITGVVAGDEIDYKTATEHNRVLIDNVGNDDAKLNAAFDIGGFSLINSSVAPDPFRALAFQDDGPTADITDGGGAVTIDETAGNQDDDSDAAAVLALFDTEVTNKGTDLSPAEFAISTTPLADASGSVYGVDGAGTTVLSLAIVGGDNTDSLLTTTDGQTIRLVKEGDLIVGRIDSDNDGAVDDGDAGDVAAFAIALQQDGNVAVAQYVSLTHPIAGSTAAAHDDRVDLSGLVNAVVTVTDRDGDTSTDSFGIGDDINFDDDGPTADVADGGGAVTIDETAGNQDDDSDLDAVSDLFDTEVTNKGTDLSPAEFAISTTPLVTTAASSFGQDEEGGTKVLSLAIVGGDNTDSLLTTTDGKIIRLFKEGALIVGRYDVSNGTVTAADPAAFAIALLQDGNVAVAQYVSLTHPIAGSTAAAHDDQVDLAGLVNAVVTVTDGDGDTSTDSFGIGDDINFDDDGPSADVSDGGGAVTIDETAGNQNDDSDAAAVLALFDTEVTNKGTDLSPAEFAISATPLATTAASSFGQDEEGGTKVLSLAIVGGDNTDSLLTTTDGQTIRLVKEGDLIVGRIDSDNDGAVDDGDAGDVAAFAIALLQDGNVAVAQYVSLTHPIAGSTAAAHDDQVDLAGLVNAVVTVTDGDGDTSTDSFGIGDDINFDDDGPTADVADGGGSVTIDETAGNQNDDSDAAAVLALFDTEVTNKGTDLSPAEFAISATPLVTTAASSFGQDEEGGTKVLSLAIVGGDNTDSLLTTTDGQTIRLVKEGDLIVGRIDSDNDGAVDDGDAGDVAAFAIALQQDGNVAVAQYVSLTHPIAGSTAAAHDDRVDLSGLVNAVVTVTDGDGDTSTDSFGIGDDINFDDDGPTADVADGGGSVTIDETAGNQNDDSDAAAVLALFDTEVTNKGTDLSPAEFAISTTPLVTTAASSFGQDEEGGTKVLSLAIVGGDNTDSLLTTTDGKIIRLFKEGALIVGRYDVSNGTVTAADPAAFAIALLQNGNVAVAQYVSLTHPIAGSTAAAHDDQIDLAGLVNAVVTVTDGDGDTSTDSFGIGDDINFDDDGPTLSGVLDSTNSLVFALGTSEAKGFTYNAGADNEEPQGVALIDFTDPDDAGDLAASGLDDLEALLGIDITATQSGNTVTYYTPDGGDAGTDPDPLFQLVVTDAGWTFNILQDAALVFNEFDFSTLPPGSPLETISLQAGTGTTIGIFNGLLFGAIDSADGFESRFTYPPNSTDLPGTTGTNTDDDLNPDAIGFGVRGGAASNMNNNEGFSLSFFTDSGALTKKTVEGMQFKMDQQGNTDDVVLSFELIKFPTTGGSGSQATDHGTYAANAGDGNDPDITDIETGAGVTLIDNKTLIGDDDGGFWLRLGLPSGNNDIFFTVLSNEWKDAYAPVANEIVVYVDGDYETAVFRMAYPDTGTFDQYPGQVNDSVRIKDITLIEVAPIPNIALEFTVQGTDGDGDTTQTETFNVFVSEDGLPFTYPFVI